MNYHDAKKQFDDLNAASRDVGARLTPIHEKRSQLMNLLRRRWKLGHSLYVSFEPTSIDNFYNPLGLSFGDEHGSSGSARLTVAGLARAANVALHIQGWMNGRFDDLKPSGLWDNDVPSGERTDL